MLLATWLTCVVADVVNAGFADPAAIGCAMVEPTSYPRPYVSLIRLSWVWIGLKLCSLSESGIAAWQTVPHNYGTVV